MIDCTPASIIEASKCYCGLTAKEDSSVAIYLLCTWANQEGGPVTCGTPSDVIQISGAGNGDSNGIYVRNPSSPLDTFNSMDDPQAGLKLTAGHWVMFYGLAFLERYYSTTEDFPCTWTIGPDGTLPVPTGQWLSSPPVAWAPANEPVTWQDSGGVHVGDLPTFLATANFPSVSSLVFGATGNLTSLTGLKYLPSLSTVDCNTNALTSLDCTNCASLTTLNCSLNASLTTLTLTGCTSLLSITADSCNITGNLDVSPCSASLTTMSVNANANMTSVTLTGCSLLTYMDFGACGITGTLVLSPCTSLAFVDCYLNPNLTAIDLTGVTTLAHLDCDNSNITGVLNVTPSAASITLLKCFGNPLLTGVNVTGCSILDDFECANCAIATLDVSTCVSLTTLDCSFNLLSSLDVSACVLLAILGCSNNALISLDVSSCTVLNYLNCSSEYSSGVPVLVDLRIGNSNGYNVVNANDNALPANPVGPAEGVDDVLHNLKVNCLGNNGFCYLNTVGTNASPTGGVLNADYVSLTGAGWTIAIN